MQLVIDIPEKDYYIMQYGCVPSSIIDIVAHGKKLPERHGRLIDASELMEHACRDKLDSRELIWDMINNAPTVVETNW